MKTTRRQSLRYLAGIAAGGALAGCAMLKPSERLNFVLVHGSWQGAWSWDKVVPLLRNAGHQVTAVELQGQGTPIEQINLSTYTKRVTDALDAQSAPAILLGHSSGCLFASQAAEERPEKVRTLVFLSGFVALNGESGRALQGADPGTKVPPILLVDFRPGTKIPLQTRLDVSKPDAVKLALYNDCSDADARAAMARLVPEPAAPSGQPLRLSAGRFGRLDKVYVHCSKDNAISLPRQRQFAAKWPMRKVITLDSGHSPFLSMPKRLSEVLASELHESTTTS
jgi:pimeloyl-ACP methyl ester carboxylesterase